MQIKKILKYLGTVGLILLPGGSIVAAGIYAYKPVKNKILKLMAKST